MREKMTREHKLTAYVLNKRFGCRMVDIAKLLRVSLTTVSTSIKEVKYWMMGEDLAEELARAQMFIEGQGFSLPAPPVLHFEDLEWSPGPGARVPTGLNQADAHQ
ncbi:MAG: hypothetical protein LBH21_06670 [Gracilibacteraceae bacterium]|jgi:hypothetical protein|nr:hypothetical protein [Gracilibacteraceae bacterium]